MVSVFNKELLSWYLVTLKLRENVDRGLPSSSPRIEFPRSPTSDQYWMISVQDNLEYANKDNVQFIWDKLCIYKVPQYLRDGEDKAYIPNFVSLGPFHHRKQHLRAMDHHKWRAFSQILKRGNQKSKLYLDSVRELEESARACYEGQIRMGSYEFVEMMVLDGCFVLELLRGASEGFTKLGYSASDPVFAMKGFMYSIQRDMLMLENQIPMFILDRLLGLQLNKPSPIANLVINFFEPLMPTNEHWTDGISHVRYFIPFDPLFKQGSHLLDLFRMHLLIEQDRRPKNYWIKKWSNKRRIQGIHCVTELKEAGIRFERRYTPRFWDIEFKNGVLKIPQLVIHDGTKSLFLNLIAFEQSHSGCGSRITSYAFFMDNLINSQEDVRCLHNCGILQHHLGSDADVADMFNRLCREVDFNANDSYLSDLPPKVNKFYNRRWNKWRASLMHNYFYNPWVILSLTAAMILLILTLTQTFYGVYGYYKSPS